MSLSLDKTSWKRVTLKEVIRHVTDRVDAETSGLERFLAGEHIPSGSLTITDWGVIGRDPIGPMFYKRFKPGHVLYVSRRTYLRKVAVPEFEGITGEKTFVLETLDENLLLQEFLPFVLSAERFHAYAIAHSRGSVNPYLNWGELAAYEFDLPPLDEQQRLADLLWALERHRRLLAEQAVRIEATASAWLQEVLSSEFPLKAIPDLVLDGPRNGRSAPANDEGRGVPTLSISAIRGGNVLGGDAVKYMDVTPSEVAAFVIQDGDFLIVRGNGNKRLTGLGGLADASVLPEGCVYPDLLIRLRFDPSRILPKFAAAQWNSKAAHARLLQNAKSTNGIWKINGKDVKAHSLAVPPLTMQQRIVDQLQEMRGSQSAVITELDGLVDLRSAISNTVFGGAQ
ncbi:restriction endonuclease subunit S [Streptomyces sp. NPDC051219]|uniref:restriction endonuclease subunit S n=1 Tax=Streptomyces sp. NPDC051219 TaxID=3155283 RepID=UPI00342047F5